MLHSLENSRIIPLHSSNEAKQNTEETDLSILRPLSSYFDVFIESIREKYIRFELHQSSREQKSLFFVSRGGERREGSFVFCFSGTKRERERERHVPFHKGNLFETFLAVFFGTKNGVT